VPSGVGSSGAEEDTSVESGCPWAHRASALAAGQTCPADKRGRVTVMERMCLLELGNRGAASVMSLSIFCGTSDAAETPFPFSNVQWWVAPMQTTPAS
jgi:hypothetical protein